MLELLENAALALFRDGYGESSHSVLRGKMRPWLKDLEPSHQLHGRNAAELIEELKRDGILIAVGESRDAPLLFLHRILQECLAARELARRANDKKGKGCAETAPSHPRG